MTTTNSSPELMDPEPMLNKDALAELLPAETRAVFLAGCAEVERGLTHACATKGGCLESGCALDGESCLNAVLDAAHEYNKACRELWIPLYRLSKHAA